MKSTLLKRKGVAMAFLGASVILASCGGGGGGGSGSTNTSSINYVPTNVYVQDNAGPYQHAILGIYQISMSAADGNSCTLFSSSSPLTIDFASLSNIAQQISSVSCVSGNYTELNIVLSSSGEFVTSGSTVSVSFTNLNSYTISLPINNQISGTSSYVDIDLDLAAIPISSLSSITYINPYISLITGSGYGPSNVSGTYQTITGTVTGVSGTSATIQTPSGDVFIIIIANPSAVTIGSNITVAGSLTSNTITPSYITSQQINGSMVIIIIIDPYSSSAPLSITLPIVSLSSTPSPSSSTPSTTTTPITQGNYSVLYNFSLFYNNQLNGMVPIDLQVYNGTIYGLTKLGGTYGQGGNGGVLFSYNPSNGSYSILYNFGSSSTDANTPVSLAIYNGTIYGVSASGGKYNKGAIFECSLAGSCSVIYSFGSYTNDASRPLAITISNNGLIYGISSSGGLYGYGALFSYNTANGSYSILHNFSSSLSDCIPGPAVGIFAAMNHSIALYNGNLYGVCNIGGSYSYGALFSYNTANGSYSILHDFGSSSTGALGPTAIQIYNNNIYGVSYGGGIYNTNGGVLFDYNLTNGSYSVLHNFGSSATDINAPVDIVINNGVIYGISAFGGLYNEFSPNTETFDGGTLFECNLSGNCSIIHNFGSSTSDGAIPSAITTYNNIIYGLTGYTGIDSQVGLNYGLGTIFQYTP